MLGDVGAHVGALYLLVPDEHSLGITVMVGLPTEFAHPWLRIGLDVPLPLADVVRRRSPVWVSGAQEMVRRYPRAAIALPYDFPLAALPIIADGTVHGAVFVLWPGGRAEAPPDETVWERMRAGVADIAGLLDEAERAGAPIRPTSDTLEFLPHDQGTSTPDVLASMADRLPEGMCSLDLRGRLTAVTPTAARLLGEPAERLVGVRLWGGLSWLRDPVYEDRYRAALITQRSTSFVAVRPPDRWLSFELYPDRSGVTARVRPVNADGRAEPPSPSASPPGPATPTRVGAFYHLLELASALTEARGVRDVVDTVADQIMPAFGGQALALLTVEAGRLRVIGYRGYEPSTAELFDHTPITSFTPGAHALVTGAPTFFETREDLERVYPARSGTQQGMGAWAFLPLIASGRPIGTCVLAFTRSHQFSVEERAVLNSLGGLIAQALERARLYDVEHELARGLQSGLLPHELPALPGLESAARYLPGTEGMDIGGDFYDLIRLGEDEIAAVVGDVQGHNVTAAALMGQVRTAVRAYAATSNGDPERVLARTNRLLTDLDPGLFVSCVYLHLNLRRNEACLARAGHPQPLLRHPSGRTEVVDVPGGLLLGIDPTAEYPEVRLPMPPGAILALYTDGLVEEPGVDLDDAVSDLADRLGREGDRPLGHLANRLTSHAHLAEHRTDDVVLLLLRTVGEG
ncbi:Serine phosphatase RsbU, regulator of sigma subunit [Marinactinospora thermotolerans DSM 45154]|uniref:protein-serine/threonine phosphatase n=2 Tax=Marinactinospora thermotolerans TaxID=531310 RepID=A0A1T4SZS1_9ACTN|nr:Serine phosphatase RsbU, regulator of sigma subunit [Marinactinospora thermotolerans DSM 45154]